MPEQVKDAWRDTVWASVGLPAPTEVALKSCLFRQGERASEAHLLVEGVCKLVFHQARDRNVIVGLRGPGQFLGVGAAILGRVHLVSAVTVTECKVSRLSARRFRDLVRAMPELSWQLHQKHCEELYFETGRIGELGALSARQRLLQLLDRLRGSVAQGREVSGEHRVNVPLKQWEIAQLLAITPAYLCELIGELEREGLLRREGDTFALRRRHSPSNSEK